MEILGHSQIALTMNTYSNPRESHRPGGKPQVSRSPSGGAPGARTQNPRIKRAGVYGPGESGEVRDLGRVLARHHPDGSELQPELQPRARGRCSAASGSAPGGREAGGVCRPGCVRPRALACGLRWPWMVRCWCTVHVGGRVPHARCTASGECPLAAWVPSRPDGERAAVRHGGVPGGCSGPRGSPAGGAGRGLGLGRAMGLARAAGDPGLPLAVGGHPAMRGCAAAVPPSRRRGVGFPS